MTQTSRCRSAISYRLLRSGEYVCIYIVLAVTTEHRSTKNMANSCSLNIPHKLPNVRCGCFTSRRYENTDLSVIDNQFDDFLEIIDDAEKVKEILSTMVYDKIGFILEVDWKKNENMVICVKLKNDEKLTKEEEVRFLLLMKIDYDSSYILHCANYGKMSKDIEDAFRKVLQKPFSIDQHYLQIANEVKYSNVYQLFDEITSPAQLPAVDETKYFGCIERPLHFLSGLPCTCASNAVLMDIIDEQYKDFYELLHEDNSDQDNRCELKLLLTHILKGKDGYVDNIAWATNPRLVRKLNMYSRLTKREELLYMLLMKMEFHQQMYIFHGRSLAETIQPGVQINDEKMDFLLRQNIEAKLKKAVGGQFSKLVTHKTMYELLPTIIQFYPFFDDL